ncbi:unnamed protein product [Polarella glacialis]|uniref:Uncharacterized protein n=1 Tax=Polarella glacialis TaxID=89957 RepID=A0A813FJW5_POLGL|nr:unnamed protein product [Polarella glacialis]
MWRPDPGPCVAQVAEWGEHADDVEYMRQLKALSKKILKRREVTVKDADLAKACQKQGKVHFSVACWNLSEYSRVTEQELERLKQIQSGPELIGDASSLAHVFYEGKEGKDVNKVRRAGDVIFVSWRFAVLNAFSSAGIDLEQSEAVPVDPNSSKRHEQQIMYAKECLFIQDDAAWEQGPPLSPEEITQRLKVVLHTELLSCSTVQDILSAVRQTAPCETHAHFRLTPTSGMFSRETSDQERVVLVPSAAPAIGQPFEGNMAASLMGSKHNRFLAQPLAPRLRSVAGPLAGLSAPQSSFSSRCSSAPLFSSLAGRVSKLALAAGAALALAGAAHSRQASEASRQLRRRIRVSRLAAEAGAEIELREEEEVKLETRKKAEPPKKRKPYDPTVQPGAMAPLGFFDPLGFCPPGDEANFRKLRASELKHGRVGMMASVGLVAQHFFRIPLFGLKEAPSGMAAAVLIPSAWCFTFVVFASMLVELLAWKEDPGKEPGNFGDPLGLKMYDREWREREISNGRFAMICTMGILGGELATGKDAVQQFGF